MLSGEAVVRSRGSASQVILPSSAIPADFPPVEVDGRLLCDGAIASARRPFTTRHHSQRHERRCEYGSDLGIAGKSPCNSVGAFHKSGKNKSLKMHNCGAQGRNSHL
jgi:predicted acylesterase/phospholipase RssA